MKLTPFQYKVLKVYQRYQINGLTAGQILRSCSKSWALLVGCALLAYLLITPASPSLGGLAVGLFAGAMLRDVGHYRVALRMWQVNREIFDWKKVAELVESHEKDVA
jgi:hypothetical protein